MENIYKQNPYSSNTQYSSTWRLNYSLRSSSLSHGPFRYAYDPEKLHATSGFFRTSLIQAQQTWTVLQVLKLTLAYDQIKTHCLHVLLLLGYSHCHLERCVGFPSSQLQHAQSLYKPPCAYSNPYLHFAPTLSMPKSTAQRRGLLWTISNNFVVVQAVIHTGGVHISNALSA